MSRRAYGATLQFRTTFDQAGRIAGLAGELDTSEAEVLRRLVDRALAAGGRGLLDELRGELAREQGSAPSEAEIVANTDFIVPATRRRGDEA